MKKILLVHPLFPITYWGFQDAVRLVNKRATVPPLGLITLAACLPESWELRLVDLNVGTLQDDDILWADVIFLGGMLIQLESMLEVTRRAHRLGRPVVVGGPTATTTPEVYPKADVVFQGEAEGNIDALVEAVESLVTGPSGHGHGRSRGHRHSHRKGQKQVVVAASADRPDISEVPVPRYDLLNMAQYSSMSMQHSRGCPFQCEFCDVVEIFGRVCRVKSSQQILAELDEIHRLGFRGSVFVVDDNFIGNKRQVRELLPRMAEWQAAHGSPFDFYTEASINLASDRELMTCMVDVGFRAVFVGIETPSKESLEKAGKHQNLRFDLEEAVDTMTRTGLEVMGGFIVGFDQDGPEIFGAQLEFIQDSPIPLAMVGMLAALPGTALWRRLESEGRLRGRPKGDQFARSNFVPAMNEEVLLRGYRNLMRDIYSPDAYYRRCHRYVDRAGVIPKTGSEGMGDLIYLLKILWKVGVVSPRRFRFWRLLGRTLKAAPHTFKWAVIHALQGEHMIRYTREHLLPRLDRAVEAVVAEKRLSRTVSSPVKAARDAVAEEVHGLPDVEAGVSADNPARTESCL